MLCPECSKDLKPNAKRCTCGWVAIATRAAPDARHGWCEWVSDTERCRYPGTQSAAINGSGPWYCGAHFACHDGQLGAQIVELSIRECGHQPDYSYESRRKMFLKGIESNARISSSEHSLAVLGDLKSMLRNTVGRKPGRGLSVTTANESRPYIDHEEAEQTEQELPL